MRRGFSYRICLTAITLAFAAPVFAQTYAEIELTEAGSVAGTVRFEGTVPAPLQLLITKDLEVCGEGYRERKEVDTTEDLHLRNVAIFIEEVDSGKPWSQMETGLSVNQETCFFQPHIQVIPRASEIEIINSDSTLHNIHAYELIGRARRSLFNISQPEMGPVKQLLHPRRGNQVSLECDSHDFMQGWILVTDHPYATTVDANGSFEIASIPPGTYALHAWHPRLGMASQEIIITKEEEQKADFVFSAD